MLVIWLVALPWASRRASWQTHSRWLEQKQIDPSAMYYTDLPLMRQLLKTSD